MEKELTKADENQPTCQNCKYWRTIGTGPARADICAYNPPKVTHTFAPHQNPLNPAQMEFVWQTYSGWPLVSGDKWCGKHERVKH